MSVREQDVHYRASLALCCAIHEAPQMLSTRARHQQDCVVQTCVQGRTASPAIGLDGTATRVVVHVGGFERNRDVSITIGQADSAVIRHGGDVCANRVGYGSNERNS